MIEPVTLYDSTTIINGQSAILRTDRMTPPGNRPMLVRDILFTLSVVWQGALELQLGALVRARINIGRFITSAQHIPIWLYGAVPDAYLESLESATQAGGNLVLTAAGASANFARYRWVLPKPMYVPPGTPISASFAREDGVASLGFAGSTAITVQMSARGILLHQKMPTTQVPYVGAFVPESIAQVQTREDDMRNVLDGPINVHRLIGRVASSSGTSVVDALGANEFTAATAAAFRYKMRLRDSNGLDITNGGSAGSSGDFIPMCSIFPAQSRAWTFKKTLAPKEQLLAQFDRAPAAAAWPMISFVGSREERCT